MAEVRKGVIGTPSVIRWSGQGIARPRMMAAISGEFMSIGAPGVSPKSLDMAEIASHGGVTGNRATRRQIRDEKT